MTGSSKWLRILIWTCWPIGVVLYWTTLILNIRAKHGGGLYWAWSPEEMLRDLGILVMPPLILDLLFVKGRNNG